MSAACGLTLVGLEKSFGSARAVQKVDLTVHPGELVTLVGPSGSGKTTVLRLVAGFLDADAGQVIVGEEDITQLAPERRDIGMVFQSYALFPHMNVERNIAFGLDRRKIDPASKRSRLQAALELVRLEGLEARYPAELSGGQRQRVALARALVIEPRLLLLDEPLSNLDAQLRETLRDEIRSIQKRVGITTLLVTHDQEEALTVSDRVAVLHQGRLHQVATPQKLYEHPVDSFVAGFIGKMNWLQLEDLTYDDDNRYLVGRLASGETIRARHQSPPLPSTRGRLALRPETIVVGSPPAKRGTHVNVVGARLAKRSFFGDHESWRLALPDGSTMVARVASASSSESGIGAIADTHETTSTMEHLLWWPPESGVVFFD